MVEVKKGDECTITIEFDEGFILQKGDEIVAYEEWSINNLRILSWSIIR